MAIKISEYIAELNKLNAIEMRMGLIYQVAAQMITGPWRDALAEQFAEHAEHELAHAAVAMRRLVALGGTVGSPIEALPVMGSLSDILKTIEKLEEEGVRRWQELYSKLDSSDAFRHQIEEILSEEQHHWDEARRWNRDYGRAVKEQVENVQPSDPASDSAAEVPADEEQPEEPEPDGPESVYPVVGEQRVLKVFGTGANGIGETVIGDAWQDETGALFGTGICHMMLFEPFANSMYSNAAAGLDASPLSVLAFRLAMNPFIRIEWEDSDAD